MPACSFKGMKKEQTYKAKKKKRKKMRLHRRHVNKFLEDQEQ